tara:strand:- start:1384 stop:2244 length:861 start_codon:yes stop_codon:yes gene_type:complete
MFKIINYFFQSIFIYFLFLVGRILGLKISKKLFSFLFRKIGPFFKSKKIINQNLDIYSKDISRLEKNRIIEKMWENYGMTFIEYIFLKQYKNKNNHININGNNNLLIPLKKNKPVIFVSGHFSNFELMSMEITKRNIKLATIYRPLNNIFLNPFMEFLRKKYVCKNQIKKGISGVREAIDYIKNDYSIALMIDQRVSEGENIPFFDKPALTTTLPAQLAIKYNLTIIPVFIKRISIDKFEIKFDDEINPENFNNKQELTKKLNTVLEKMIMDYPFEWIWTHNRWKQ